MGVYTGIDKPEDYFKTVLYTGTHSSVPTVTVGFKSDFLWLKSRTQTYDHNLLDTTRGGTKKLSSNNNNVESTTGDSVTFNATTFQPSGQAINESGQGTNNMVSWSWKSNGGTTASNSNGTITSTVQANDTAGFSIVTWTASGSSGTVGHGLSSAPTLTIRKSRGSTADWFVHTTQIDGSMDGLTGGSGVFCGTVAGSGNQTKASGSHTNNSVCSSSPVTAGKFTETLTHFGGSSDPWKRIATADNINGTSAEIKGILVDTNGHLASIEGEVDKLEGLVTFASSITVTDSTSSLTMSFNLGEGMSLNSGGGDSIHIGSGPFQAIMTAN